MRIRAFEQLPEEDKEGRCDGGLRTLWSEFMGWRSKLQYNRTFVNHPRDEDWAITKGFSGEDIVAEVARYVSEWAKARIKSTVNRMLRAKTRIVTIVGPTKELTAKRLEEYQRRSIGVLNLINRQPKSEFFGASYGWMLASSLIMDGKIVQRIHVTKGPGGKAKIDARVLDPYFCAHDLRQPLPRFIARTDWDRRNIEDVIRSYALPGKNAPKKYQPVIPDFIQGRPRQLRQPLHPRRILGDHDPR